jgi:hypothetical protein
MRTGADIGHYAVESHGVLLSLKHTSPRMRELLSS